MIYPEKLIEEIESKVSDRIVTVGDLLQRKHPIHNEYKVGFSKDLTRSILHCLLTLSDEDKQSLIDILKSQMSPK